MAATQSAYFFVFIKGLTKRLKHDTIKKEHSIMLQKGGQKMYYGTFLKLFGDNGSMNSDRTGLLSLEKAMEMKKKNPNPDFYEIIFRAPGDGPGVEMCPVLIREDADGVPFIVETPSP